MKLELKYLSPYLPYGLNIKDVKHGSVFEALHFIITPHQDFNLFKGNLDQLINDKYLKPILFPLSSLTKEITINGKKIKIIDKIEILTDKNHFEYILRFLDVDSYEILPYWVMELLFSCKIDIFGLIEAGLAEPVTEYFNPYK